MKIESRKLTELANYPRNPRQISKEAYEDLKRKIKRWGQLGALLSTAGTKPPFWAETTLFRQ